MKVCSKCNQEKLFIDFPIKTDQNTINDKTIS